MKPSEPCQHFFWGIFPEFLRAGSSKSFLGLKRSGFACCGLCNASRPRTSAAFRLVCISTLRAPGRHGTTTDRVVPIGGASSSGASRTRQPLPPTAMCAWGLTQTSLSRQVRRKAPRGRFSFHHSGSLTFLLQTPYNSLTLSHAKGFTIHLAGWGLPRRLRTED